jgi:2-phospho-L-lactate transferase/gluconeogenesis factor (CofD/UPF0052 family)
MPRKLKNNPFVTLNQEALKYCFKEGYKIYPTTDDNATYKIEVTRGNDRAIFNQVYNQKDIHQAIADVYLKIYNKHLQNEKA